MLWNNSQVIIHPTFSSIKLWQRCLITAHYSTVDKVHDMWNSPFLVSPPTYLYLKLVFFSGALSDNQNHPQSHPEIKQVLSYQFNHLLTMLRLPSNGNCKCNYIIILNPFNSCTSNYASKVTYHFIIINQHICISSSSKWFGTVMTSYYDLYWFSQ